MQRILQPGQIEALAQRSIPRIRLPQPSEVFASRATRLRELAAGNAIGDYLRLMATLVEAQHVALIERTRIAADVPDVGQLALAREHGMPLLQAAGRRREHGWRNLLKQLCATVAGAKGFPASVAATCERIALTPHDELEAQADALLTGRNAEVDGAMAPFVMAALQVCWVDVVSRFAAADVQPLDIPGICPICGSLPVASIIRTEQPYQGYRFLHCALCATEWHMVRVMCTQCQATKDIGYHSIDGGADAGHEHKDNGRPGAAAVRAESCDTCHSYRKILYRENDSNVDPVADDLATMTLDLLMTEAGYHRGSGNPLLWQNPEA
ncbi:MAG TPA: formate dehydrogenase accessory protein FdhE [Rudaea sp.]|nr:formate dehydrogenase accessory protein FdhE [Rudaea sp.]